MKLLLVEDDRTFGQAFKAFLTAQGHEVTWLRSVDTLDPFVGTDGSGTKVAVEASNFSLALIDGQLDKSPVEKGEDVTAQLLAQGLKVLGISSQDKPNQEMVRLGAVGAANKAVVFVSLYTGLIAVEDIANGVALDIQSRLQQCTTEVKSNADARHRAEEFLLADR